MDENMHVSPHGSNTMLPAVLRLPLKKKWFGMTKAGIKTEDYREINDFWCRRIIYSSDEIEWGVWNEMIEDLGNNNRRHKDIAECLDFFGVKIKHFDTNVMTLGYPSNTDIGRILKLEHKGIEIRTGNPDWGAEPGKVYFVILHGDVFP